MKNVSGGLPVVCGCEVRGRQWIKGEHGYFAGSIGTGGGGSSGGANSAKAVDKYNFAKQFESFNVDVIPSNAKITPKILEEELNKSDIGKETLKYIKDTEIRPILNYEPQYHTNRGMQFGNRIEIYMNNIQSPLVAAQTVIHEITHHKYGIGKCQWAEAVCMAKEKMHKENRKYLTISEKRYIVRLARKYYGEYNWKKGGIKYGKPI